MRIQRFTGWIFVVGFVLSVTLVLCFAQPGLSQPAQPPARVLDEARTVYLGNLARRQHGLSPLRWNRQLTEAARWYSWDSVEQRAGSFCGHQDSNGHWPNWRARAFGYVGNAGAENAFCGYVTPEQAIEGWLKSPGHRANLLDPNSREIGLGYYLRDGDQEGYVTQDFGHDPFYPPVIIENEAISINSPTVNLYIHDRESVGTITRPGPAVDMMISNHSNFSGATWETYQPEKSWTFEPGTGWRTVYVKTRDVLNRTTVVSDVIYLGDDVPVEDLGASQMSTTQSHVTLSDLETDGLPLVQFSLGWLADDTMDTFALNWGNGERVNDDAAWGETAFQLIPGNGESSAWVWTTDFVKDVPLVAYFRLKVSDNTSSNEVVNLSIEGGGIDFGPIRLRGRDFTQPYLYQEFPLAFTFPTNNEDKFLIFKIRRTGSANIWIDAVSIFTAPQPVSSRLIWAVPGRNYRGQGVWLRYTDGDQEFSPIITLDHDIQYRDRVYLPMVRYSQ